MLCELTIENIAVIEKATVLFNKGFNVLTGETGAGKSILIDSINAILGNRTSRDIVRSGAEKAVIWASFRDLNEQATQSILEAGYECDGELLLYREISKDGKSTCRINGKPATAAIVRDICGQLINIHGQHDNQNLLDPSKHLGILDTFAEDAPLLWDYKEAYRSLKEVEQQLADLSIDEDEKLRQLDLLRYQVEEIEMAQLEAGEDEELNAQKNKIRHAEKIVEELGSAYEALSGDDEYGGAIDALSNAADSVSAIQGFSEELVPIGDKLSEIYYTAKDLSLEIKELLDDFDFDGNALDEIEERLDLIYRLKKKYGPSIEEILQYGETAAKQLEKMQFADEEIARLENEQKKAYQKASELAGKLTAVRTSAFEALSLRIKDSLTFLNMENVAMGLRAAAGDLASSGRDTMEFYISTNLGEEPKPLSKIASGGELSRIMLAIKNAMADKDEIPTLIYDEIDTGISGSAAGKVGAVLKSTAAGHQVICVTHTGQIAACADTHLYIEKKVQDGRTYTGVRELDLSQRAEEIARMVQGDNVTALSLQNAREMLEIAQKNT